jgi:hypothetical protein
MFNNHGVLLSGLMVSVLAIAAKAHGFKPGLNDNTPQHAFLRKGSEDGGFIS